MMRTIEERLNYLFYGVKKQRVVIDFRLYKKDTTKQINSYFNNKLTVRIPLTFRNPEMCYLIIDLGAYNHVKGCLKGIIWTKEIIIAREKIISGYYNQFLWVQQDSEAPKATKFDGSLWQIPPVMHQNSITV